MSLIVSVALPVRNGGAQLEQTLAAVRDQRLPDGVELEVLVCDSASDDGSETVARRYGADVFAIPAEQYSHGGTRNLLMERSHGRYVAFLTQDAVPASNNWLAALVRGFSLADRVGLVYGPYRPRPDASPMVGRELVQWFSSFSPDGTARIDRLAGEERALPARALLGARGFFTDANGCVSRTAWREIPFRDVPYAEDHVLAHDMLRAGYTKVFLPGVEVIHSHDYGTWDWVRRSFDEARALAAVYGYEEPLHPWRTPLKVWGLVGADRRWVLEQGNSRAGVALLARSLRLHAARTLGSVLGGRSRRLSPAMQRRLSLEGRTG